MTKLTKITANLIVPSIEACLPFWVGRLGFEKTVEVPHEGRAGFVILKHGDLELMLQSTASVAEDVPALADGPHGTMLYVEVADLAPIREALDGYPTVIPERTTFYGAREILVKDPAGNAIAFAAHEG
jgi:catechol 2,3-dioxygenase-like lactoylglutathione lyase family enzyme